MIIKKKMTIVFIRIIVIAFVQSLN